VAGATAVIVNTPASKDPAAIWRTVVRENVSHIAAAPAVWTVLVDWAEAHRLQSQTMRLAVFGGAALNAALAARLLRVCPRARVVNIYGTTESLYTAHSVVERIEPDSPDVAVGVPMPNMRVHVLDRECQKVAAGVIGELYVAGGSVSRGYVNQPALTATKFVADPWSSHDGERLYRTGDSGVMDATGRLTILGRVDNQVNIHGFNVELEDVEHAVRACSGVKAVAVRAERSVADRVRLEAYVVRDEQSAATSESMRAELLTRVPAHMVPAVWYWVETIPVTPSGKIDGAALGAMGMAMRPVSKEEGASNSTERALSDLWSDVLQQQRISVDDTFVACGGDSLSEMRLIWRIHDLFNIEIQPGSLLRGMTLRQLAALCTAG
jgi:acyl-coenzyme A synthetase/AMP-(fatty) acid ligase/acyl carrier protein